MTQEQTEEMHRARYAAGAWSFHDLSGCTIHTKFHVLTNPEALQTVSFWGFTEASLHSHG